MQSQLMDHHSHADDDSHSQVGKVQKVEKLLEYLFNTQIKAITYWPEQELISVAFRDGKI